MDTINKVLYTAKTHTTGGRDGASRTSDGRLDVMLSTPGTSGTGTNPEQLFAAGWSACFMSAIALATAQRKVAAGRPGDRRRGGPRHERRGVRPPDPPQRHPAGVRPRDRP